MTASRLAVLATAGLLLGHTVPGFAQDPGLLQRRLEAHESRTAVIKVELPWSGMEVTERLVERLRQAGLTAEKSEGRSVKIAGSGQTAVIGVEVDAQGRAWAIVPAGAETREVTSRALKALRADRLR
jgi:hypothetical protein